VAAVLGHFPSVAELGGLNRYDLSNAICKHGGSLFWSDKTGIPRRHSDSDTGWEGERAVLGLLKKHGFEVDERQGMKCPYDLIVNQRVRCDVKTARQATYGLNTGEPWSAWFYRIGKAVQSDIVILYRSDLDDCFVLPWWRVGETNITISPNSPKYNAFHNNFGLLRQYEVSIARLQASIDDACTTKVA
jgi:hypothetical protein